MSKLRVDTIENRTSDGLLSIPLGVNSPLGIGITDASANLHIEGGSASSAPLKIDSGTNLTTAEAGAIEYDGTVMYATPDTTSGRGIIPATQFYSLIADGSAIGPTIASFFGANSSINLAAGGKYKLDVYFFFTKTTAGTVTFTFTTSEAVNHLSGTLRYGAATGGTLTGAANQIALFGSSTTANAFAASVSLTTAVNHDFTAEIIFDANASLASTLTINVTCGAGTVTPLRNSYYILTRLPSGNQGIFS
jgi:hypothetical protein